MEKEGNMKILLVCSGNICRSPTAEGLLRQLCAEQGLACELDSAGTHGLHAGEAPDHRAVELARQKGIDISTLRARQVTADDFDDFDIIYAMDAGHMQALKAKKPTGAKAKLKMFYAAADVPDPWYGDMSHFIQTYDIIAEGAAQVIKDLKEASRD